MKFVDVVTFVIVLLKIFIYLYTRLVSISVLYFIKMRKSLSAGAALVVVACLAGCKKDAPVPVITVDPESVVSFPLGGGQGQIKYSVTNAAEGTVVEAVTDADWISEVKSEADVVTFVVAANNVEESRSADIVLTCGNSEPATVTVSQASALTFNFSVKTLWANKVVFEVSPSDPNYTYVADTMNKERADGMTDAEIVASYVEKFTAEDWYGNPGTIDEKKWVENSWGGYYEGDVWKGTVEITDNSISDYVKDYYFIAFGLDLEGNMTSPKVTRVPFTAAARSVIAVDAFTDIVPVDGGSYTLNYSIENPKEGEEIKYSLGWGAEFIQNLTVDTEKQTISFDVPKNEDKKGWSDYRQGSINLTYADAYQAAITVKQQYAE